MAQLRAKQIKLVAQDDLLIGGANGNGAVLTKGTAGQVLKVLAGGALGYEKVAAADTTFADASFTATDVAAALVEAKKAATDEATRATTKENALQSELDATQNGAGLGTDGTYTADATTEYLKTATSLKDADKLLDTKLQEVAALAGAGTAGVQEELDRVEAAVGLNTDGTFTPLADANYADVKTAATVKAAIAALDAALFQEGTARLNGDNTNATAITAEETRAKGREDAIEDAVEAEVARATGEETRIEGLVTAEVARATGREDEIEDALEAEVARATAAEGDLAQDIADEKARAEAAELKLTDDLADEVARALAAEGTIQGEVDAIEAGAGLSTSGAYIQETTSNYINSATTLAGADMLLDAAIKALDDSTDLRLDALEAKTGTDTQLLQDEIDAVEAAVGLDANGDFVPYTGTTYLNATTTLKGADVALDAAVKAVDDRVTALGAAFNYVGTVDGGATEDAAFDLATLPAGGKDAGDYYKVATSGYLKVGAGTPFYVTAKDGIVWNKSGGVDVLDNTNSQVLAGANIEVTGSSDTGFTVALDGVVPTENGGTGKAALESVTAGSDKIVLGAGAANSVVNAFTIDVDSTKILFKDLSGVNTPGAAQEGKYLKWTSTGLAYVSAAELGSTVHAEEDFTPTTAADATVTLAHTPSGAVAVFINGVKLKNAGFQVTGTQVKLSDLANGYGVETGDTVSVSYNYAA